MTDSSLPRFAATLLGAAGCAAVASPSADVPSSDSAPAAELETEASGPPNRTVFVHLFEWSWTSVATECERVLGPAGYAAVQVSPPQEYPADVEGSPWWDRYQPVSYAIAGRSGDRDAFADMVARCEEAGVDIYVDAVLNHMAAPHHGIGIAGSSFTAYDYPPVYAREHFHECRQPMGTGPSRAMLQRCGLFGLPDLDTGDPHVQRQLAGYLDDLAALGVEGFRIDAAKHIAASELEAVLASLEGSESESPFVFAEVIADETIRAEEYFGVGRVTEFAYGERLSELVREGELARLSSMTESSGLIRSDQAVVFVDNHDNQRGHGDAQGVLTHRTVDAYKIANVFMLAWPYGYPKVMSSFAFDDDDARPAVDDDGRLVPVHDERGRCRAPYVCEHRWPEIVAMVDFRHRCRDAAVSSWWSDDRGAIGFAREGCGYVALNAGESPVGATVETSLPPGHHCDVLRPGCARRVEVDDSGRATITIPARGAIALLP